MNRNLIIIILFISIQVIGQDSVGLKNDTTVFDKTSDTTFSEIDTVNLDLKNDEIEISTKVGNTTKVILVKEKSKIDFLKYLLPIFTLILGIAIKEIMDKWSNKKKLRKSGERWIAELRSLEEPIEKQIESLQEFLQEHEKEEFSIPRLQVYSSLSGEIFKSLDKNDLIKYIELNNNKSDFKEIVKISNRTNGYVSV